MSTAQSFAVPNGLMTRMRRRCQWFGRAAVGLVFPDRCIVCRKSLEENRDIASEFTSQGCAPFCADCRRQMVSGDECRCRRCGALAHESELTGRRCASCQSLPLHFDKVVPLGSYRGTLRDTVLQMKEPTHRVTSQAMARLLLEHRGDDLRAFQPDLIAAVPMYWSQRWRRGVNSAEDVAYGLARRLRVPFGPRLLIRRRNTQPQSYLPRMGRFENVRDAFRVSRCYRLNQPRVLLIDDILTTGATCSEAAKMLKQRGGTAVAVAVIARSIQPDRL